MVFRCFRGNAHDEGEGSRSRVQGEGNRQINLGAQTLSRDTSGFPTSAKLFPFREIVAATEIFREDYMLGNGGHGRVYRGFLGGTREAVVVKRLDSNLFPEERMFLSEKEREFLAVVVNLVTIHHQNLVTLVGSCHEWDQRLLVYEYMPLGSLDSHLHDLNREPLDWNTRMKIAAGAARGLQHLHCKVNPQIMMRDLKPAKILLDRDFTPKISDYGFATFGPNLMRANIYWAPEYALGRQLTAKSDIYSFGIVLLELLTGRKAWDEERPRSEWSLVEWARPMIVTAASNYAELADPKLLGRYPTAELLLALAVALRCIKENADHRPSISEVVEVLDYLESMLYDGQPSGAETSDETRDLTIAWMTQAMNEG